MKLLDKLAKMANNAKEQLKQENAEQAERIKIIQNILRDKNIQIEQLKEALQDCTCQGGHSEAYLKAKGKL